jgi:hypothetical protein
LLADGAVETERFGRNRGLGANHERRPLLDNRTRVTPPPANPRRGNSDSAAHRGASDIGFRPANQSAARPQAVGSPTPCGQNTPPSRNALSWFPSCPRTGFRRTPLLDEWQTRQQGEDLSLRQATYDPFAPRGLRDTFTRRVRTLASGASSEADGAGPHVWHRRCDHPPHFRHPPTTPRAMTTRSNVEGSGIGVTLA